MNICSVGWISSLNIFWCWHISRSPRCFFRCKRFTHSNPTCLLVRIEEFLLETSSISPSRSIDLAAPAWYLRPTWIATSPPWPASFEPQNGSHNGTSQGERRRSLATMGVYSSRHMWIARDRWNMEQLLPMTLDSVKVQIEYLNSGF